MLSVLLALENPDRSLLKLLDDYQVDFSSKNENLLEKITKKSYDILLLEGSAGRISSLKGADPRMEILLIGGNDVDEIEVVKLGATACFRKPVDIEKFKKNVESIHDLIHSRHEIAGMEKQLSDKYTFAGIAGKNPRMLEVFNYLRRIAPYFKTVTIPGETGAGKEIIARALHSISPSAKHPFMFFNCAAFVENLIESELFGHKKGAFTGAISDKEGIFEMKSRYRWPKELIWEFLLFLPLSITFPWPRYGSMSGADLLCIWPGSSPVYSQYQPWKQITSFQEFIIIGGEITLNMDGSVFSLQGISSV